MKESIYLPESVVQALGRVAWAAINLEDWTNSTCELALGEFDSRVRIGPHIDKAVALLEAWEQPLVLSSAIAWLVQAKQMMIRRNQILHAVPVQTIGDDPKHWLVYFHKGDKQGYRAPNVETSLTIETLLEIAFEIEATLDGWRTAHFAISGVKAARDELAMNGG